MSDFINWFVIPIGLIIFIWIAARLASDGWHSGKWKHFKKTMELTKEDNNNEKE